MVELLLLAAGADTFALDRWGRSPVRKALLNGNARLVKLLESHGPAE